MGDLQLPLLFTLVINAYSVAAHSSEEVLLGRIVI